MTRANEDEIIVGDEEDIIEVFRRFREEMIRRELQQTVEWNNDHFRRYEAEYVADYRREKAAEASENKPTHKEEPLDAVSRSKRDKEEATRRFLQRRREAKESRVNSKELL